MFLGEYLNMFLECFSHALAEHCPFRFMLKKIFLALNVTVLCNWGFQ